MWTLWLLRRRIPAAQTLVLTLAGWAVWQVLFGPGSERLAYLLLAPTMSWAVLQALSQRCGRTLVVCSFAAAFVLGSGVVERSLTPLFSSAIIIQPLATVMFVVWLVCYGASSSVLQAQEEAGEVFEYRVTRDRRRFSIRTHDVAISPPTRFTSQSASRCQEQQAPTAGNFVGNGLGAAALGEKT